MTKCLSFQQRYITFLKNLNTGNTPEPQADKAKPTSKPASPQQTQQPTITPLYEILGVKRQKTVRMSGVCLKLRILEGGNKTATVYYNGTDDNFKRRLQFNSAVFYSQDTGFGKSTYLAGL